MSYWHHTNADGTTATVPDGMRVLHWSAVGDTGGGTVVITPRGESAQSAISVGDGEPMGDSFFDRSLVAGSTLVFTDCVRFMVRCIDQ